jgi:hypothetical protein
MSNVTDFQVANLPTMPSTILAELVIQLPPKHAAVPAMTEDIPQSTNWRPRPAEGGQHLTTPLAYSYNYRDPSWEGQLRPCGYS